MTCKFKRVCFYAHFPKTEDCLGNLLEREGEKEMKNKNKTLQFCKMRKKFEISGKICIEQKKNFQELN